MFDYKNFKNEMVARGHKVNKNGKYITIVPNNNYIEYGNGFQSAQEVVDGFQDELRFVEWEHYNGWIYSVKFRIA